MNLPTMPGPCDQYEHEIADLVDGLLGEAETRRVRTHMDGCPGCSAWATGYAAVDRQLAQSLPRPVLSAGFDAALQSRIRALQAGNGRDAKRAAADAEHEALLAGLRRHTSRRALFGALGTASAVGCGLIAAQRFLAQETAMQNALLGSDRLLVFGAIGTGIAMAALAWSLSRSAFVLPRIARW